MSEDKKNSYDSFLSSKFFSTKHTNYFPIYDQLFSRFVGKPITFVEVGILGGGLFTCGETFSALKRE
jgi:hypothetical protein